MRRACTACGVPARRSEGLVELGGTPLLGTRAIHQTRQIEAMALLSRGVDHGPGVSVGAAPTVVHRPAEPSRFVHDHAGAGSPRPRGMSRCTAWLRREGLQPAARGRVAADAASPRRAPRPHQLPPCRRAVLQQDHRGPRPSSAARPGGCERQTMHAERRSWSGSAPLLPSSVIELGMDPFQETRAILRLRRPVEPSTKSVENRSDLSEPQHQIWCGDADKSGRGGGDNVSG